MMRVKFFKSTVYKASHITYIYPSLRFVRVTEGSVEWKIGDGVHNLSEGDIILFNNLAARKMLSIFSEKLELDVFEFSPKEIHGRSKLISAFYSDSTCIIRKKDGDLLSRLLSALGAVCEREENDQLIYCQLQAVFCLLEELVPETPSHSINAIAFDAANFIWENFSADISVPQVADKLGISKSHLEKEFKNVHGICVGEYLREIRVYMVGKMIREHPEMSVLEIAISCGFNSSSGFYKAYKTVIGKAPKKERRLST